MLLLPSELNGSNSILDDIDIVNNNIYALSSNETYNVETIARILKENEEYIKFKTREEKGEKRVEQSKVPEFFYFLNIFLELLQITTLHPTTSPPPF